MKSVTIFYSKNNNPDPKDFFHIPAGSKIVMRDRGLS